MTELEHIKAFRQHAAAPSAGMQERIQETLLQHVLEAEAAAALPARRHWWPGFARQGGLAAVAALLIVALSFSGGRPTGETVLAGTAPAGYFPAVAKNVSSINPVGSAPTAALVPGTEDPYSVPTENMQEQARIVPRYAGEPSLLADGPSGMTLQQLKELPADPRVLLQALRDASPGRYPHRDADFGAFRTALLYLSDPAVPAPIRAAIFRTLGYVDGIEVGGAAADVVGRGGLVVTRLDGSGIRQQYLIDAESAVVLEYREYTAREQADGCPIGTVTSIALFDRGYQVPPSALPNARWPVVAPICG